MPPCAQIRSAALYFPPFIWGAPPPYPNRGGPRGGPPPGGGTGVCGMQKRGRGAFWLTLCCVGAGALLLVGAPLAGEGARAGLRACYTVIIPALFPFMALAGFVAATPVAGVLSRWMGGLTRVLYGVPGDLAPAVLMSWIGGYPAGARVVSRMAAQGRLSPRDAGRALTFTVHSGPAFMAGVVGASIFGSVGWGLFVFACQLLGGVLTGRLLRGRGDLRVGPCAPGQAEENTAAAFVRAVMDAASGTVSICAFVILFSAVLEVLAGWGLLGWAASGIAALSGGLFTREGAMLLLRGMVEVCSGCAAAGAVHPAQAALALPFVLSFSSLSVICQVASCFGGQRVPLGRFVLSRLVHGLITAALASPVLYLRMRTLEVFATGRPVLAADGRTVAGCVCLLFMCAILFLTIDSRGNFTKSS